jgi:formate/nitrite transporter FocA (FNT family)
MDKPLASHAGEAAGVSRASQAAASKAAASRRTSWQPTHGVLSSNDRPAVGADPANDPAVAEIEVEQRFLQTVDHGRRRLSRRIVSLLATGAVGGVDVGMGVLALFVVERATHSKLLGAVAFSIGFVTLTFASSELFTEDFLIPVVAVMARQVRLRMLLRLWVGTLVANLVAGWVVMWFVMHAAPQLGAIARADGHYYSTLGVGVRSFSLAVLGGAAITLMTWMQQATDSMSARTVPAVMAGFLLVAARLDHAVVASLVMFAALIAGHGDFGYLRWAETAGWAVIGNVAGGVGLVTVLRVLQVPHRVRDEQLHPAPGVPIGDRRRVKADEEPD